MKTFQLLKVLLPLGFLMSFLITTDLTGTWNGKINLPNDVGSVDVSCTFVQKDSVLTGSLTGPDGTVDISNGKVSGNDFSFDMEGASGTNHNTGKYYGDSITVDFTVPIGTLHSTLIRAK